jgi:phage terminase small subunit
MTTAEYITLITEGSLSLVKDNPSVKDEATLGTNEYFVLMFCTSYKSYLKNYVQYKNKFNYNTARKVYDIDIDKYAFYQGYYISKSFRKRYDTNKGRTIIVSVVDRSAIVDLDDIAPCVTFNT